MFHIRILKLRLETATLLLQRDLAMVKVSLLLVLQLLDTWLRDLTKKTCKICKSMYL